VPSLPQSPPTESLDLPELDKGDDNDDVDVGTFELDLNEADAELDEAPPVDTFEIDIQVLTDSGSNEAASDLDVGGNDLLPPLPDANGDRDDEGFHPERAELDLHLDSPLESDEPSSDAELGDDGLEQLPALVSEEGDGDAGPDVERAYLPSAPEGAIARGPDYSTEWLLLGTPCSALWAERGSVLGAAEHLMRFGQERSSHALAPGTRVSSLCLLEDASVLLATTRGLQRFTASGSSASEPEAARVSGADVVELASARGGRYAAWARSSNGALSRLRDATWERHETGGIVRALTSDEQRVTLLVVSHRPTLQVSSDSGSSFREILLPEPAATVAQGAAPTAVSRGPLVALADPERGLCISNDGGETFRMIVGAVNVSAVTIGEHAGAPTVFAAVYRESRDLTQILAVDVDRAEPLRIAELAGQPEEDTEETGRTQALVFTSGALWAGGGYGLTRLTAPQRG
jgi:hypothetical protein